MTWTTDDHHKARKIFLNVRSRVDKLDGMTSSGMRRRISVLREGMKRLIPYAEKGTPGAKEWAFGFAEQLSRAEARRDSLKKLGF